MGILSDINELKADSYLVLVSILLLLVPGVAIVFHFRPDLFSTLDILKITALAMTFGISLFVILFLPVTVLVIEDTDDGPQIAVFLDICLTFFILMCWLMIAYYFKQSFHTYISEVIITSALSFILLFGIRIYIAAKKKKTSSN